MAPALAALTITVGSRSAAAFSCAGSLAFIAALSYLAAASLCYGAARRAATLRPGAGRLRRAWTVLALLMLGLGVIRQLDLQTWLTGFGRELALEQGWYGERARFQRELIAATVAGVVISGAAAAYYLRRELRELWPTLLGAQFIVAFVLIRASSLHCVDQLLSRGAGGVKISWILELLGTVAVAAGAARFGARAVAVD